MTKGDGITPIALRIAESRDYFLRNLRSAAT